MDTTYMISICNGREYPFKLNHPDLADHRLVSAMYFRTYADALAAIDLLANGPHMFYEDGKRAIPNNHSQTGGA
jgi:hypothetical protein